MTIAIIFRLSFFLPLTCPYSISTKSSLLCRDSIQRASFYLAALTKGLSVNVQQNTASFKLLKNLDKETNGKWVVKGNPLHQSAKQAHGLLVEISPWALKCPRECNPLRGVDQDGIFEEARPVT